MIIIESGIVIIISLCIIYLHFFNTLWHSTISTYTISVTYYMWNFSTTNGSIYLPTSV